MNLKTLYNETLTKKFFQEFKYSNIHQIPKLQKIIITAGLGLNAQNKKYLNNAIEEFRIISGQHPILTRSKKSVAAFKIREGMVLGLKVTLRREKMYAFLERLIKIVLPRIRDFQGLNANNFDSFGNYHFGISEQLVFPEIDYDTIDHVRGFNISIITTSKTKTGTLFLLKGLGVPFTKE